MLYLFKVSSGMRIHWMFIWKIRKSTSLVPRWSLLVLRSRQSEPTWLLTWRTPHLNKFSWFLVQLLHENQPTFLFLICSSFVIIIVMSKFFSTFYPNSSTTTTINNDDDDNETKYVINGCMMFFFLFSYLVYFFGTK